jgi:hypothetical protein
MRFNFAKALRTFELLLPVILQAYHLLKTPPPKATDK